MRSANEDKKILEGRENSGTLNQPPLKLVLGAKKSNAQTEPGQAEQRPKYEGGGRVRHK
jgi:hypothetical protein